LCKFFWSLFDCLSNFPSKNLHLKKLYISLKIKTFLFLNVRKCWCFFAIKNVVFLPKNMIDVSQQSASVLCLKLSLAWFLISHFSAFFTFSFISPSNNFQKSGVRYARQHQNFVCKFVSYFGAQFNQNMEHVTLSKITLIDYNTYKLIMLSVKTLVTIFCLKQKENTCFQNFVSNYVMFLSHNMCSSYLLHLPSEWKWTQN